MSSMNRTLVIGATGNIGREVVLRLAANDHPVRALSRKPDEVCMPPYVEVVQGDLTSPESLDGCLAGIDAVFLVWTAPLAAFAPALARFRKTDDGLYSSPLRSRRHTPSSNSPIPAGCRLNKSKG